MSQVCRRESWVTVKVTWLIYGWPWWADAGGVDADLGLVSALRHSIANWNSTLCVVGHNEQQSPRRSWDPYSLLRYFLPTPPPCRRIHPWVLCQGSRVAIRGGVGYVRTNWEPYCYDFFFRTIRFFIQPHSHNNPPPSQNICEREKHSHPKYHFIRTRMRLFELKKSTYTYLNVENPSSN